MVILGKVGNNWPSQMKLTCTYRQLRLTGNDHFACTRNGGGGLELGNTHSIFS